MAKIAIHDVEQSQTLGDFELSKVIGGRIRRQQGRIRLDADANTFHPTVQLDRCTFGLERTLLE